MHQSIEAHWHGFPDQQRQRDRCAPGGADAPGDLSAFETSVERYRAALIARAHARLASFADAEDVVQSAFVQAYFHLHELRNPEALLSWLRRITDRLALMHLRNRREQMVAPGDLEEMIEQQTTPTTLTDNLGADSLLSSLPTTMREVVSLTFLAGYTCAEAARIMGIKEGTVKSRLNRARIKLKEVLGMSEGNIAGSEPAGDFTCQTIERLKREARRLQAEGDFDGASLKANAVINEQIKLLVGDTRQSEVAQWLQAFDNAAYQPDEETIALMGLPFKERRRSSAQ